MLGELTENNAQSFFRNLLATLDSVAAIHKYLWLDDRHQPGLLAQGSIASQRMGVSRNAVMAGTEFANGDDCAPFAETSAKIEILFEMLAQAIQAFGNFLAREIRQRICSFIDLDPGDNALRPEQLKEGPAIPGPLPNRFIKQDHSADRVAQVRRSEKHLPVGASVFFRRGQVNSFEPFRNGRRAFVCGQNPFSGRYQR